MANKAMSKSESPVETVVAALVAGIREGHLSPGQRLVEGELASRLGVARTTIREALQRLEVNGLVTQERHRGFLVRQLSQARLQDMYEVREALEALAAQLAAPKIKVRPDALVAVMARLNEATATKDLKAFTEANHDFHSLIRHISGNEIAEDMLERLDLSVYHLQFRLLIERPQVFSTNEDHQRIADALFAGDGNLAARESAKHVRHSLGELLKLPATMFGQG
ncbi:GntR family transcriptional regulator [Sphingomonas sp.]|uniref:GntR family transcriptional regulator n=1 Tax=Sphingomonas sp. TaxID=28214 RepID=UPI003D6D4E3E